MGKLDLNLESWLIYSVLKLEKWIEILENAIQKNQMISVPGTLTNMACWKTLVVYDETPLRYSSIRRIQSALSASTK